EPTPTTLLIACDATVVTLGNQTQCRASVGTASGSTQDQTAVAQWASSDQTIATVSASGLVTSLSPGTVEIRATFQTLSASQSLTILSLPPKKTPRRTN